MGHRDRLIGVAVIMAALLAAKLGHQVYSWYAHEGERTQIEQLSGELEEVGVEVVTTQLAADSLRWVIERMDGGLEATRRKVESYGRRAVDGALPGRVYDAYRAELDDYNRGVGERNSRFEEWRAIVERNHAAVDRFNRLADSIRGLAIAMGEPYFSIPTPAEIALERGLEPPVRR
jgi:hypothetical protein